MKAVDLQIHSPGRLCTETQWQEISPPETQPPGASLGAPRYRDLQRYQAIIRICRPVPSYSEFCINAINVGVDFYIHSYQYDDSYIVYLSGGYLIILCLSTSNENKHPQYSSKD